MKSIKILVLFILLISCQQNSTFSDADIFLEEGIKNEKEYFLLKLKDLKPFLEASINYETESKNIKKIISELNQYYVQIVSINSHYIMSFQHYKVEFKPFEFIVKDGGYFFWNVKMNKEGFYDLIIHGDA